MKVTECLSVAEQITNRWTDKELLNSEASYRPREGF